jgi:hypothetical protein
MQLRSAILPLFLWLCSPSAHGAPAQERPAPPPSAGQAQGSFTLSELALPGAPAGGVSLDYLAVDRVRHRVWVPAGGTGNVDVIDTATQQLHAIEKFPTGEVERGGRKRTVGTSSATVGDGFVYVGNRADASVCAIDATSLARAGCVTMPSSPDGLAYVAKTHEVWVTTPRDNAVAILDVGRRYQPLQQQTLHVDENVALLSLDQFAGVKAGRIDAGPPFSALLTLWLSTMHAVGLASRSNFSRHLT